MNDGFSDPEPAEEPGIELVGAGGALLQADIGASCEDCSHFGVCAAFKGFNQLLSGWEEEMGSEPPMEPDNLALICEKYDPAGGEDVE